MWKNCTCCKVGILFILTVVLQCKCIFFVTFKHRYFVYEYFMLPAFRCTSTGDEGIKKIRELSVYREKWVEFFEVVPSEPHHYFYILVLYEMRNTESLAMYVCMVTGLDFAQNQREEGAEEWFLYRFVVSIPLTRKKSQGMLLACIIFVSRYV